MKKNNKNQLKFFALALALIGVLWLLFAGQGETTRVVKIAPTPTRDYSKEWAAAQEYVKRLPARTPKPKAAQKKPKKGKKMATKIARGTTKQISFDLITRSSGIVYCEVDENGNPIEINSDWHVTRQGFFEDSCNPLTGWVVGGDGSVTVPNGAGLGVYTVIYYENFYNGTYDAKPGEIEVVCMMVAIVSDAESGSGGVFNLTASHSGGQGTYTDTWSKVGAGTLTVSGNNATLTLADGETATATVNSQDGGGIADYVPCTATASRNFTGGATAVGSTPRTLAGSGQQWPPQQFPSVLPTTGQQWPI